MGEAFLSTYLAILRGNIDKPWSEEQRFQQEVQRGRYVEFNLLWDRGTLFGLKTGEHRIDPLVDAAKGALALTGQFRLHQRDLRIPRGREIRAIQRASIAFRSRRSSAPAIRPAFSRSSPLRWKTGGQANPQRRARVQAIEKHLREAISHELR